MFKCIHNTKEAIQEKNIGFEECLFPYIQHIVIRCYVSYLIKYYKMHTYLL